MNAPPLRLFCDSDCLIQLFIVDEIALLRWFKSEYDLASVIVPEVENELAWHTRFKDRFESPLRNALSQGALTVFHYAPPDLELAELLPPAQAATISTAITATGGEYRKRVGVGEAYSHAACVHLGAPMLSHDYSAIRTLRGQRLRTAAPTLRLFDLIGLAYKRGHMNKKSCELVRKALLAMPGEFLPPAFRKTSFAAGFGNYDRRLFDRSESAVEPSPCVSFDDRYFLTKK